MQQSSISFVIPFYNEEKTLKELYERILSVITENNIDKYQIIFVNDGSKDESKSMIDDLCLENQNVELVSFGKNLGKSKALKSGFEKVKYEIVVIMDADLQDDPKDLTKFLDKINEGYDFVCGYRTNRKDSVEKKLRSHLFNEIFRVITKINLHDCNCGFKVFTKKIAIALTKIELIHSYIAFQAYNCGFDKITEVKISHHKRLYGKSKYGIKRYITGLCDIVRVIFMIK